jgi:hypothetical protein
MNKNRLPAFILLSVFVLTVSAWSFAQTTPNTDQQAPSDKQDKDKDKDKDKKKKKSKSQDVLNTEVFNDDVARYVLSEIRDGLEGHMQRLMLSAFDDDEMPGYLSFEDQIQAMFDRYTEFRVHFNISQATVEGPKGIVLVDFQLEEIPKANNAQPQRKSTQMRFELQRGRKGWRVVDFSPRGFFS